MADKFYTVGEIARKLRVDPATVYRWIWDGELRAIKAGGWKIREDWLEKFAQDRDSLGVLEE